jgi:hypothetical protein
VEERADGTWIGVRRRGHDLDGVLSIERRLQRSEIVRLRLF